MGALVYFRSRDGRRFRNGYHLSAKDASVQSRRAPVPDHYGFTFDGIRAVLLDLYLLRLGYDPEFIGLVNGVAALAFTLVSS